MGGVAGHLAHLYDNRNLTYNQMADILQKAAKGELIGTEKTDGFNIFLGYVDGKARAARNKGDMAKGGMTMEDLVNREFRGGEKSKKAYVTAFSAYEKALDSLSNEEKDAIFGPAGEIFYNTEIQGPIAPNVVNYDENILNIHHMGHKRYNRDNNTLEVVENSEESAFLDNVLNRFEQATSDEDFSVRRTAFLELNRVTDENFVNRTLEKIQNTGYSGDMTLEDYLASKIYPMIKRDLPELDEQRRQLLVNRMLGVKGTPTTSQIAKGMSAEERQKVSQYNKSAKFIIGKLIEPIELAIHELAVELLRGLKSAYILDNHKEVKRLKKETEEAINAIKDYEGPGQEVAHEMLAKQLEKLKHHDNIDTVVEGFVFQYDGPGKFKPPHRGHLDMIKHYLEQADRVVVLISPKAKDGITPQVSEEILKMYINDAGLSNVDIEISADSSPVRAAIEYGNEPEMEGTNIILGASTKGGDAAQRFAGNMQQYVENATILNPLEYAFDPTGEELNASDFRAALQAEEEVNKFIPIESSDKIEAIVDMITGELQEDTHHFMGIFRGLVEEVLEEKKKKTKVSKAGRKRVSKKIPVLKDEGYPTDQAVAIAYSMEEKGKLEEDEEEIEEISSMAGGAVAGYSLPLGAKPQRRKKKRNLAEQEVNDALNYLLEKLGI